MTGMKYIMYEENGIETPILFPPVIEHSVIARNLNVEIKLISAGFVYLTNTNSVLAEGRSHSLDLRSRLEDSKIIHDWLTFSL
jgi:hypothetical protein